VNQKGGVGKTTTAINLAASVAHLGEKTLLVDLDPQANATSGLGLDQKSQEANIYHLLAGEKQISDVILPTSVEFLDLVPSHINLVGIEVELISKEGRENHLKNLLSQFNSDYSYIFIDCPPSLSLLTINALCSSNSMLVPIQCEYYALEGLSRLMDTLQRVQDSLNPNLNIEGILMTMYDSRIKLGNDVISEVAKAFPDKIYKTKIPRNVRLAESPGYGKPVLVHDPSSRGAQTYLKLAKEFLERNGWVEKVEKIEEVAQEPIAENVMSEPALTVSVPVFENGNGVHSNGSQSVSVEVKLEESKVEEIMNQETINQGEVIST